MTTPTPLAVYLVTLRKGMGIDQPDLAAKIGLSVRQLSRFESGVTGKVGSEALLKVFSILPVSMSDVVRLAEDDTTPEMAAELAHKQLQESYHQARMRAQIQNASEGDIAALLRILNDPDKEAELRRMIGRSTQS
jgi:transcriptional regulator with XRE-family HTH domain